MTKHKITIEYDTEDLKAPTDINLNELLAMNKRMFTLLQKILATSDKRFKHLFKGDTRLNQAYQKEIFDILTTVRGCNIDFKTYKKLR